MKKRGEPVHGWVAFDKPLGMTSTQAVAKIRWLFNAEKAGHGGTLDPLATGLLPIALGEATKTVQWAMEGRKVYRFTAAWGDERNTDDLEGDITATSVLRPSRGDIEGVLKNFTGDIQQTPPAFSAIKIGGERAYDLARAGEAPEMQPRSVTIEKLTLTDIPDTDHAIFDVICGKGTYIRSMARDVGRALSCLAHVSALRRIQVGPLKEADMISLDMLTEMDHKPSGFLRQVETMLDGIPALAVTEQQAQRLRQGQPVLLRGSNAPIEQGAVLVTWGQKPLGICSIEQGSLRPKRLFNL